MNIGEHPQADCNTHQIALQIANFEDFSIGLIGCLVLLLLNLRPADPVIKANHKIEVIFT